MSSEFLVPVVEEALYENQRLAPQLRSGAAPMDDVLGFCRGMRTAGIAKLLLTDDGEALLWHLHQSGAALAHVLAGGKPPPPTSHFEPFLDAVAAGDAVSATALAQRAPKTWTQGREYEEDFLFMALLMQHFILEGSTEDARELLARYEKALQGSDDARFPVCQALVARDGAAFESALVSFLEDESDAFEELSESQSQPVEVMATVPYFSIRGLVFVKLAERLGFPLQQDYPRVPSSARLNSKRPFHPDDWMNVQAP